MSSGFLFLLRSAPLQVSFLMATGTEIDIDQIIGKLLEVRGNKPGKQVQLSESEIQGLILKSREQGLR